MRISAEMQPQTRMAICGAFNRLRFFLLDLQGGNGDKDETGTFYREIGFNLIPWCIA